MHLSKLLLQNMLVNVKDFQKF